MIIHNCASFGSLVHRAQGYKKLKEERSMASRFYIPEPSTRNLSYYLVSENCQAVIKSNGRDDFLEKGSLVFSTSRFQHKQLEVKIVDVNTKNNIPQEIIYRCCPDKLIKINEKVWNLIAPIKSPEDRIKIAKDAALCEELCSIDVGSFVVLYSRFLGKVTAKTTKKDGMGVLFEVSIQEMFENYRSASFEVGDKVIVAADALRLYPFSRRTSPKSRSQNDLNSLDSSQNQLDIDEVDFSNNYGNNNKFRGGDNVMWINKEMFTPATICWSSRIHDKARIHLDTECKEVCCDRSFTKSVSTKDLMSMEEFLRKYNTPEKDRKPSFHARNNQMTDSSRFINLLDLNELQENVSNLKSKSSSSYKGW